VASIHKSQGSEYSAVVIPVMTQHYTLHHAPAESALHRHLPGQEAGRAGRPEEGCGNRGSKRLGAATLVKTERMAQDGRPRPSEILLRKMAAARRAFQKSTCIRASQTSVDGATRPQADVRDARVTAGALSVEGMARVDPLCRAAMPQVVDLGSSKRHRDAACDLDRSGAIQTLWNQSVGPIENHQAGQSTNDVAA
jgi:hypothetical protein